jgi:hypothetical protein
MSEKLKLAEAYYTVANHMAENGRMSLDYATTLCSIADRLCEENMRETTPPETGAEHESNER